GVILDHVISNDNTVLYQGMRYPEIIRPLALALPNAVNTVDIACHYQTHGDRHFPGAQGPWEQFSKPTQVDRNQLKDAVNRILEILIRAQKGRIRRNANGQQGSYYYTLNTNHPGANPTDPQTRCSLTQFLASPPPFVTIQIYYRPNGQ